jgi:hypothetical protein
MEELADELPEEQHRLRVTSMAKPFGHINPAGQTLLWAMVVGGVPIVLGQLVCALASSEGIDLVRDLDYVELFSGAAILTSAMRSAGYRAATFDNRDDPVFGDFNGDAGFAHALHLAAKIRPGGGVHSGIVNRLSRLNILSGFAQRKWPRACIIIPLPRPHHITSVSLKTHAGDTVIVCPLFLVYDLKPYSLV